MFCLAPIDKRSIVDKSIFYKKLKLRYVFVRTFYKEVILMKKLFAFALAVVMVMSVSTAAFAYIEPNCGGGWGGGGGKKPLHECEPR